MTQSALSKALHSRPFQMEGARFAMEHKSVLIADEPGLGKTIQSIGAVIGSKTRGSVLVVAPKTAVYVTWPLELKRWLSDVAPNDKVIIVGGKLDRRGRMKLMAEILKWEMRNGPDFVEQEGPPRRQWVLLSPNYVRYNIRLDAAGNFDYDERGEKVILPVKEALVSLLGINWAGIIVDEAHQTLAGATGNIKAQSAQSRGLRLLSIQDNGLRLALSGTPFRGKHENLWGVLNFLDPVGYGDGKLSYWKWIRRHFEVYIDDAYGQEIIGKLRDEKALAAEARRVMIRRTKKKVLPELPDKQYGGTPRYPNKLPPLGLTQEQEAQWYAKHNPIAVWLPMDPKQAKAYEQMKIEAIADIEGGQLLANSILAERTRLKQFANSYGRLDEKDHFQPTFPSNKFEWLLQFLSERGIDGSGEPSGNKVVIGSQFTRHVNLFARELEQHYKIQSFVLTGKTSEDERVRMQEEFQAGVDARGNPSPDVFLMNYKAGGVALTLDAADDVVVVDRTHNPDDQTQFEDRCHRISRVHNVTVWNLCSLGTIDTGILKETQLTARSLRRILDSGDKQAAIALLEG